MLSSLSLSFIWDMFWCFLYQLFIISSNKFFISWLLKVLSFILTIMLISHYHVKSSITTWPFCCYYFDMIYLQITGISFSYRSHLWILKLFHWVHLQNLIPTKPYHHFQLILQLFCDTMTYESLSSNHFLLLWETPNFQISSIFFLIIFSIANL